MSITSKIKRNLIAPILYRSGFAMRKVRQFGGGVILNYHGVLPEPYVRINNRHVSTGQFEQDLKYYRKHFRIVSLKSAFEEHGNSSDSRPWLAVTFDDGFVNNLNFALPLLTKYEVPATIFVLSAPLENERFVNWADLIDVLVRRKESSSIKFLGENFVLKAGRFVSLDRESRLLVDAIKDAGPERCADLDSLMADLWKDQQLAREYEGHFRLMNLQELRRCSSSPFIEIGSHSKLHYNLGRMSDEVAMKDLSDSKLELESALQVPVDSIAYPDGDYTDKTKDIAETLGYARQLAVTNRLSSDSGDKRIRRRFSYSNSTTHESNMLRLGMQWAANYIK